MRGLRPINWTFPMAFAERSVDVLAASAGGFMGGPLTMNASGQLLAPPPPDVQPRILLPAANASIGQTEDDAQQLAAFYQRFGFTSRFLKQGPQLNATIIDGDQAMVSTVVTGDGPGLSVSFKPRIVQDRNHVASLQAYFDQLWAHADSIDFHSTIVSEFAPSELTQAVEATQHQWTTVIGGLLKDPDSIYKMHPRRFEELVAELLSARGFDVQLTPPSGDGGRDILASKETDLGRLLHLVECKRYAPHRPIGVGLVTTLYGTVETERATNGVLVTTSRFTKGAIQKASQLEYRIDLKDYEALKKWLRDYQARSG